MTSAMGFPVVTPNIFELLPQVISHFGEPFADSAALPLWYLSERARDHVTVALLGDGGDEGFAGYEWYRTARRLQRLARKGRRLKISLEKGMDWPRRLTQKRVRSWVPWIQAR